MHIRTARPLRPMNCSGYGRATLHWAQMRWLAGTMRRFIGPPCRTRARGAPSGARRSSSRMPAPERRGFLADPRATRGPRRPARPSGGSPRRAPHARRGARSFARGSCGEALRDGLGRCDLPIGRGALLLDAPERAQALVETHDLFAQVRHPHSDDGPHGALGPGVAQGRAERLELSLDRLALTLDVDGSRGAHHSPVAASMAARAVSSESKTLHVRSPTGRRESMTANLPSVRGSTRKVPRVLRASKSSP